MGLWTNRVVPRLVDRALSTEDVMLLRSELCADLRGRVLEIGFGSGLNLEVLPEAVTSVDAVEPADAGWALSGARRTASRVPVVRTGLDGERLDADDASYDAVLSTFTLCTIPDPATALAEVRRVLRPGGALFFLEHGLGPSEPVVGWQHRLEPAQRRVFGGCHLTRDVPALLGSAGLAVDGLKQGYLPGPAVARPWGYVSRGRAYRRAA